MNIVARMKQPVEDVKALVNNDPNCTVDEAIIEARFKYSLDKDEVEYLRLRFAGVLASEKLKKLER